MKYYMRYQTGYLFGSVFTSHYSAHLIYFIIFHSIILSTTIYQIMVNSFTQNIITLLPITSKKSVAPTGLENFVTILKNMAILQFTWPEINLNLVSKAICPNF